mmetsp:Transcript_95002/g.271639  ORF Transcript_95002/g.271639 Transcript_95002/m.271639 type:complete len:289 (+) Transcript_95002:330-1196(+)
MTQPPAARVGPESGGGLILRLLELGTAQHASLPQRRQPLKLVHQPIAGPPRGARRRVRRPRTHHRGQRDLLLAGHGRGLGRHRWRRHVLVLNRGSAAGVAVGCEHGRVVERVGHRRRVHHDRRRADVDRILVLAAAVASTATVAKVVAKVTEAVLSYSIGLHHDLADIQRPVDPLARVFPGERVEVRRDLVCHGRVQAVKLGRAGADADGRSGGQCHHAQRTEANTGAEVRHVGKVLSVGLVEVVEHADPEYNHPQHNQHAAAGERGLCSTYRPTRSTGAVIHGAWVR